MRAIIESDHPNSYQYIVKFEDGSEIRCESIEEAITIKEKIKDSK